MYDREDWREEDPLGVFKGILIGLALGVALWAMLLAGVWFFVL